MHPPGGRDRISSVSYFQPSLLSIDAWSPDHLVYSREKGMNSKKLLMEKHVNA